MKPYVSAAVLYRDEHEQDFAAVITRLEPDGQVSLTFFPPFGSTAVAQCRGWSLNGSDPDKPKPNTWRWRSYQAEVGPDGRAGVAEIAARPADWALLLITYENLAHFRDVYRKQRADAIATQWPELPEEAAPVVEMTPQPGPQLAMTPQPNGNGSHLTRDGIIPKVTREH
jgi:hypothetical protein